MAFMTVSVSRKITQDERDALLKGIGEAQSILPGKSAQELAVILEEDKPMYVSGLKQDNMVYANVKYTGRFTYKLKSEFTVATFEAISKALGTSKDRMMLSIDELECFGGFGDLKDIYYS